jgi:hypothetical protein
MQQQRSKDMKLIDRPAVVVWPEVPTVAWGQKLDPIQRQKEFATVAQAARFWATLPSIAIIRTVDGITLWQRDIENILRAL